MLLPLVVVIVVTVVPRPVSCQPIEETVESVEREVDEAPHGREGPATSTLVELKDEVMIVSMPTIKEVFTSDKLADNQDSEEKTNISEYSLPSSSLPISRPARRA